MTIARFLAKALAVTLAVAGLQLGLAVPVGATEEVVLPPPIPEEYLEDDCSGQVAVMVAWDEQAWVSDVGMAIAILDNIGSHVSDPRRPERRPLPAAGYVLEVPGCGQYVLRRRRARCCVPIQGVGAR